MKISFMQKRPLKNIFYFLSWGFYFSVVWASAGEIESYVIREGTMEITSTEYIFKSEDFEERIDYTLKGMLGISRAGGAMGAPVPSGMREIGFRSKKGKDVSYGIEFRNDVIKRFYKENPDDTVESLVFRCEGKQLVFIRVKGKTPLRRVDLRIAGETLFLWSNVEGNITPEKKIDKPKK